MTKTETGRIQHVENEVVALSGRMDGFETQLDGVKSDIGMLADSQREGNRQLNILVNRTGGMEATKGMVPMGQIFTVVSIIIAMLVLGQKTLWDYDQGVDEKFEKVIALENEKMLRFWDDIEENTADVKKVDERVRLIESTRFTDSDAAKQDTRINDLEKELAAVKEELARRSAVLEHLAKDIDAHTGLEGHPHKQTFGLDHLQQEVERIQQEQLRRSERVYSRPVGE